MKNMRWLILLISLLTFAVAKDKPNPPVTNPKIEALQAEIESLKAQLALEKLDKAYQLQVCIQPDLMMARLAAQSAAQKEKAAAASTNPAPVAPRAEQPKPEAASGSQSKETP